MKKLLAIALTVFLSNATMFTIGRWSHGFLYQFGMAGTGAGATFQIDSLFAFESGNKAAVTTFNSPVTQTTSALTYYVYCTAATGTPSSSEIRIYASQTSTAGDPQRPTAGASPIATSSNTSAAGCTSASWLTYSIASVSLTAGSNYFIVLVNTTTTPASNHFTVTTSGRGNTSGNAFGGFMRSCVTSDGMTTDPGTCNAATVAAHGVLKFGDGTIIGNPWVASNNSANNQNYRGSRFRFDEDVIVSGISSAVTNTLTTVTTLEVYNGGTQLATVTLDVFAKGNGAVFYFNTPVLFPGGADIDVVFKPVGVNTTTAGILGMGTSPPADVQNAFNTSNGYVIGASPGTFTYDANSFMPFGLVIDTNPTIAAGAASGGGIIGQ